MCGEQKKLCWVYDDDDDEKKRILFLFTKQNASFYR